MGQAVLLILAGAIGLIVGVPVSIAGIFVGRGRQRWLGVLGVLLNVIIIPVGVMALLLVVSGNGPDNKFIRNIAALPRKPQPACAARPGDG